MKRILLCASLVAGAVSEGVSADVDPWRPKESIDWTGPFVGSHFAYARGGSQLSFAQSGAPLSYVPLDLTNPFNISKGTGSYAVGLSAGYNYMLPSRWVLGFEADVSIPNTISGATTVARAQGPATFTETVLASGTVGARAG